MKKSDCGAPKSFDSASIEPQLKQAAAQGLPAVNSWKPELSGDIDLRIDRQGQWYHESTRFERDALAKMFASILRKEGDDYFVLTPVEKWRIQVDDVPFLITEMELVNPGPEQQLEMKTSLGDQLCVGADHPLWLKTDSVSGEPTPYVRVRDQLDGLLSRPVFYQLVELAGEHEINGVPHFGVYSSGQFFCLDN